MGTVSMETVAALRGALEGAKNGTLTGVAAVEFYREGYRFVSTGSARENPGLTVSTLLVAQVEFARAFNLPASVVLQALPLALYFSERKAPDRA
jgi:hypothetical protein